MKALVRKQKSTESVKKLDRQIQAEASFCMMMTGYCVYRMWVTSDCSQWPLTLVTEPQCHWLLLTPLSDSMISLRGGQTQGALSAGPGSTEKPLGEIQIPDLILRTSHHRKEEETMKVSISNLHSHPLAVGSRGWHACGYIYPQISGTADLCDTTVNLAPSVAITRKLSHSCNPPASAPPNTSAPSSKASRPAPGSVSPGLSRARPDAHLSSHHLWKGSKV